MTDYINSKKTDRHSALAAAPIQEHANMKREFNPVEAAYAVSMYLPADPAVWLERAALAGVHASAEEGGLKLSWPEATDGEQVTFLNCWLNLTPGGQQAVMSFLSQRAQ